MNSHEQKQARRKQRLLDAADRQDAKAREAYEASDLREDKSGIPLGQPILVSHHSERRHRKALERANRAMERSVTHSKKAAQLRSKAAAVGQGGISSDDPDAIDKLKARLADLQISQDNMKDANRVIRKYLKKGVTPTSTGPDTDAYLMHIAAIADHFDGPCARSLINTDQHGGAGFPRYALTNNNANILRLKKRIAQLERDAERVTTAQDIDGICQMVENVEENRLQFIFDGKPDAATRQILKDHAFRWAPSQDAWQRQLTNAARYSAKLVIRALRDAQRASEA